MRSCIFQTGSMLIIGPSGCGATSLAYLIAQQFNAHILVLNTLTLTRWVKNQSIAESNESELQAQASASASASCLLHSAFLCASTLQRCVLLLDNLPSLIAAAGGEGFLSTLKRLLDRYTKSSAQSRIAATRHLSPAFVVIATSPSVSLSTRFQTAFQEVVTIPLPSVVERRRLFHYVYQEVVKHSPPEEDRAIDSSDQERSHQFIEEQEEEKEKKREELKVVDELADNCPPLPVIALKWEAISRILQACGHKNHRKAMRSQPKPFEQVVGLLDVKQALTEAIIWPRKYSSLFRHYHQQQQDGSGSGGGPTGILLYGPPGDSNFLFFV